MAYFRAMHGTRVALLAVAAFFLFATLGLLSSLLNRSAEHLYGGLLWACVSGLLAALYLIIISRKPKLFALLVVSLIPLDFVMNQLTRWIDLRYPFPSFQSAVHMYAWMALACTMTSYALFFWFIQTEGRQAIRAQTELALAYGIQKTLVPVISASVAGCQIYGVSLPSERVGGDLVDVVLTAKGELCAYIADISGHGLQAGIFMGMVKAVVRALLLSGSKPSELLERLNLVLQGVKEDHMYATCTALRLEHRDNGPCSVTYAIAGHPPLLHFVPGTPGFGKLGDEQFPVGLFPSVHYEDRRIELNNGDLLISVTDGILEVNDCGGQEFGTSRVEEVIARNSTLPLEGIANLILAAARS